MIFVSGGLFAYHEYPIDDQFDLINSLPLAAQLRAININLKELPSGAGNTNMSLRQILRVLRIAGGEELRLSNTIRRTLMVDCLPNHMKIPINEVLGSESAPEASSLDRNLYEIFNSQAYIRCNARKFVFSNSIIAANFIQLFAESVTSNWIRNLTLTRHWYQTSSSTTCLVM